MSKARSMPSNVKKTVVSTYSLDSVQVTSRIVPEEGVTLWDFSHPEFGDFVGLNAEDLRTMYELLLEMKRDKVL